MQPEPAVPDTTEPDAVGLAGHCPHGAGMLDACDPCESSTTEPDEPQDCGHDLEAFARQAEEIEFWARNAAGLANKNGQARDERDRLAAELVEARDAAAEWMREAQRRAEERDWLADTVRRYQLVIDAVREMIAERNKRHGNPSNPDWWSGWDFRLITAVAALDASPGAETGRRDEDMAEIDTTEEEIDRQFAEGEPVEIVGPQTFATSPVIVQTWPAGSETGDGDG
jgi:hypothetical protein